jgi:hypothetical protein
MADASTAVTVDRALMAHAALMTLLGLLSGFTPAVALAPRAALSAHLIGVVQGALLWRSGGSRAGETRGAA